MIGIEDFVRPAWLTGLLLVPGAAVSLHALDRARARRLAGVVGPAVARLAPALATTRRMWRRLLLAGGLFFSVVAAMQPLLGWSTRSVAPLGVDLVVALDVSRSMLASDLPPTRVERARREVRELVARARPGDQFGLVAFAGEARLIVPLTQDRGAFAALLDATDPWSVGRGGTDLGGALETALAALSSAAPSSRGGHQAIVLLTDGEDHEERGEAAAARCRERGVVVHVLGLGTALGSKIAVAGSEGRHGEGGEAFLRDRDGRDVVTALDAAGLRRIAAAGGGEMKAAAATPHALIELYDGSISAMARRALPAEERSEQENRFQWPLLLAFALWALDFGMSDRRRA